MPDHLRATAMQEHRIPDIEPHCGSWIIIDRATGEAVAEFFRDQRSLVGKVNQTRYRVQTAAQYLGGLTDDAGRGAA